MDVGNVLEEREALLEKIIANVDGGQPLRVLPGHIVKGDWIQGFLLELFSIGVSGIDAHAHGRLGPEAISDKAVPSAPVEGKLPLLKECKGGKIPGRRGCLAEGFWQLVHGGIEIAIVQLDPFVCLGDRNMDASGRGGCSALEYFAEMLLLYKEKDERKGEKGITPSSSLSTPVERVARGRSRLDSMSSGVISLSYKTDKGLLWSSFLDRMIFALEVKPS
jgi:hypothetical protein